MNYLRPAVVGLLALGALLVATIFAAVMESAGSHPGLADAEASVSVSPRQAPTDTDGDGMPDAYESAHPCLSPLIDDAASDPDGDGFSNLLEFFSDTDPCDNCSDERSDDANPADSNNDTIFDIADIVAVVGNFGQSVPPALPRHDIAPDPPDGFVDMTDIVAIASLFLQSCGP